MGVAVGVYLPLDVSTPILAGGIVAELVARWHLKQSPGGDHEKLSQNGMLFAAGLITGEKHIGLRIDAAHSRDVNEIAGTGAKAPSAGRLDGTCGRKRLDAVAMIFNRVTG